MENYRKSLIRNNRVKKISSELDAVIKRATSDSRATGSRPWIRRRSDPAFFHCFVRSALPVAIRTRTGKFPKKRSSGATRSDPDRTGSSTGAAGTESWPSRSSTCPIPRRRNCKSSKTKLPSWGNQTCKRCCLKRASIQCFLYSAQMRSATRPFARWNLIFAHSQHSKFYIVYILHSPCNARDASLVVCLYGCTIACALKQIFAKCKIFLEGTLLSSFFC